jgi:hypothetical protein
MRRFSAFVLAFGWLVVSSMAPALAQAPAFSGKTTLIMVDKENCVWCKKWEEAVGPAYAASPEGNIAPMMRIRLGHKDLAGIKGLAFAPTFVLIANGKEIGKIVGYSGPDQFWGDIDTLFRHAGLPSSITVIRPKAKLNGFAVRMPS